MGFTRVKDKAVSPKINNDNSVRDIVAEMLQKIENNGEEAVLTYAKELDGWNGTSDQILMSETEINEACDSISMDIRKDIDSICAHIKLFAEKQKESLKEFECTLSHGVVCGQKLIPLQVAGCYVPGGRFAHVASAVMSCMTANVAGVQNIICCSPPSCNGKIHPAIVYAAKKCGAHYILKLGGVQAIGSMAFGLFTGKKADILVGPGNRFVAEAKRALFGKCSIDIIAGPTELLILADDNADSEIVAVDLVSQAEHGYDSPVWLVTDSKEIADYVNKRVPELIDDLPSSNGDAARVAWRDYGEIILCDSKDDMVDVANEYSAEHVEVLCANLDWWHQNLVNYGSLFLGEETTVTYGDKCSGPNHILPTRKVANYSGGLNVLKFIKQCTYQKIPDKESTRSIAPLAARISRIEGMEGHARSADVRLAKYFPDETFKLSHD